MVSSGRTAAFQLAISVSSCSSIEANGRRTAIRSSRMARWWKWWSLDHRVLGDMGASRDAEARHAAALRRQSVGCGLAGFMVIPWGARPCRDRVAGASPGRGDPQGRAAGEVPKAVPANRSGAGNATRRRGIG